jgi:hypothetical protein
VSTDDSRVIVVRAWRDSGRTIIRVLSGSGETDPSDQWVFADVGAACRQIAALLLALSEQGSEPRDTKC